MDTPYNTYTRTGLPPTPIAMPEDETALLAAVQPASMRFICLGDGTSESSKNLDGHNRAVNKCIRGRCIMTHHGLFISFEGIDGAGKSTHHQANNAFTSERTLTHAPNQAGLYRQKSCVNLVLRKAWIR
jgi:hypothetical protein